MPKTRKEFTKLLAVKMDVPETEALRWIDAYTDTLIDIFKTGEGVTVDG